MGTTKEHLKTNRGWITRVPVTGILTVELEDRGEGYNAGRYEVRMANFQTIQSTRKQFDDLDDARIYANKLYKLNIASQQANR